MKKEVIYLLFFFFFKHKFKLGHNFASFSVHITRMTLQQLTDLVYQILPHPPYSPNHSLSDDQFFKHLDTFHSNREVETVFKYFLALRPFEF